MFVRRRERDIFRKYPWLKLVIATTLAGLAFILVISGLIRQSAEMEDVDSGQVANEGEVSSVQEEVEKQKEETAAVQAETQEARGSNGVEIKMFGDRAVEQIGAGQIVAITFDDGPSEYTGELLDFLKEKQVKATFFVVGRNANTYPEMIKREIAEGHEVESHTMNHQNLAKLSAADVMAEISGAEQTICATEGKQNCIKYLRPPYGEVNSTVSSVVGKPMIGWNIDTEDWKSKNPQMIQERALSVIKGDAIILLHDVYGTSVEGAKGIINELLMAGFTLVTIDEMVQQKGASLTPGIFYGHIN